MQRALKKNVIIKILELRALLISSPLAFAEGLFYLKKKDF